MLDFTNSLPKNMNGFRTTHTCELCGFEPKTKNKYREKQDHLVMKHFKEKIDKIFPHCRPYNCPTSECTFTGKDKQALLRHYTGKHGILEKYLREALAEKGINYAPGEYSSKRRNSSSGNGTEQGMVGSPKSNKQARLAMTPTTIEGKDYLPNGTVPITPRPNTEELRKEVEALMASFQPQQVETQMVLTLPSNTQIMAVPLSNNPEDSLPSQNTNSASAIPTRLTVNGMHPLKIQLPQHPVSVGSTPTISMPLTLYRSTMPMTTSQTIVLPTTSLSSAGTPLIMTSRPNMSLPSLISSINTSMVDSVITSSSGQTYSNISFPMEMFSGSNGLITTSSSPSIIVSSIASPSMMSTNGSIIDNDEVMWGGGLGPAVVVEAADTVPITYIESVDGSYSLDNMDYDILIQGSNGVDSVRERQLDFCML